MTCELLWPYVVEAENPSVNDYLDWSKKQDYCIYKLKFEQTFVYLQAIVNFRTGVRNNRPSLRNAARRIFAPIWSGRRHPIYRYIEVDYEGQLLRLHPEIRKIVELYSVISRSGYCNQHQGLDAILEEINKYLKALIPPVPSQRHWNIAARNCTKFIKFSDLACERRIAFIKETFENNKPSLPQPIPVTEQEEEAAMSEEKMSKAELLATINSLLASINISDRSKYHGLQQKNCNQLREILQSIRDLQDNQDEPEDESESETEN
ncbi:hypothetical protein C2G38_2026430 [Gigaspora rosea]|uniref:Uncharacterized protein n=1 Tax=Gigaspora rosea TaxID=44941 RepID=A0A397WAQ9_9GLOM|nr:hypothetical protein C2G38_2026430 [Gigaspora rosea]